jgi:hypothetical protein
MEPKLAEMNETYVQTALEINMNYLAPTQPNVLIATSLTLLTPTPAFTIN